MKVKASRFKDKSRKLTQAQKQQKKKNQVQRRATLVSNVSGKFAKKADKPLTKRQAFKLEKQALSNQRAAINAPAEVVRAIGQSVAMNVAPTAAGYAVGQGYSSVNKSGIPQLVNGGSNTTNTQNEEEIANSLPGGTNIR